MPAAPKQAENPLITEIALYIEDEVKRAVRPLLEERSTTLDRLERRLDTLFESRAPSGAFIDLALEMKDGRIIANLKTASGETITRSLALPASPGWTVKGTFEPKVKYLTGDVVMRDGSSWLALKNQPGACPGDDWQMLVQRGKMGRTGKSPTENELRHLMAEASRNV